MDDELNNKQGDRYNYISTSVGSPLSPYETYVVHTPNSLVLTFLLTFWPTMRHTVEHGP